MTRTPTAALLTAALLLVLSPTVGAGGLDIKGPEVENGETEVMTNHSFQTGFPANADRVRHSFEVVVGYGFSDRFKAGAKFAFDRPVGDSTLFSTAGIEGQLFLGKLAPAISVAWFTGLDVRVHRDETNTVVFGPLIKFGDDALSLTLNPLFEQTFGRNREDGIAFTYAAGLKGELREGLALGIEAYGSIPDLGDAPGTSFQEHRIGPVVYIDCDVHPARAGRGATKLALEIGAFVGLTEATPDLTGKIKAALTW